MLFELSSISSQLSIIRELQPETGPEEGLYDWSGQPNVKKYYASNNGIGYV